MLEWIGLERVGKVRSVVFVAGVYSLGGWNIGFEPGAGGRRLVFR